MSFKRAMLWVVIIIFLAVLPVVATSISTGVTFQGGASFSPGAFDDNVFDPTVFN